MTNSTLWFARPTGVETPTGFFVDYLGNITGGAWPVAIVFMFTAITFLSLNQYNPRKAFAASSFTAFITTTILVGLGAFNSQALILTVMLLILAIVINGGRNR